MSRRLAHAVSIAFLAYLAIPISAYGQSTSSTHKDYCNGAVGSAPNQYEPALHGWYFTWENDAAGVVKSDSDYTQGAQVGHTFRTHKDNPGLMARIASPFCKLFGFDANGDDTVLSASSIFIGQQLFTPKDTYVVAPIADQRPYAGWAYLGARLEVLQPLALSNAGRRRWRSHSFELQGGVVGPKALGEETQRAAHNLDGSEQSNGWQNQIANRWGAQAFYHFSTRLTSYDVGGLSSDVLWDASGAIGNLQTYVGTGAIWRIGRNMGPMAQRSIQPSALTSTLRSTNGDPAALGTSERDTRKCDFFFLLNPQECYLFVGVNARGVSKNIFLEGADSGAGSEISADRLVYDFTWGFRARYRWARFDYISTIRSREFSPAPANPLTNRGRHDFGSFTMSCYGGFGGRYDGKWEVVCPGFVAAVATFLVVRD